MLKKIICRLGDPFIVLPNFEFNEGNYCASFILKFHTASPAQKILIDIVKEWLFAEGKSQDIFTHTDKNEPGLRS